MQNAAAAAKGSRSDNVEQTYIDTFSSFRLIESNELRNL